MNQTALKKTLIEANSIPECFYALSGKLENSIFLKQPAYKADQLTALDRAAVAVMVKKLASRLQKLGVHKGDKVGIISNSRIEWIISDLAIMSLGAVSVSIYQSLTPKEISYILYDSEVKFLFIENEEQLKKVEEIVSSEWVIQATEDRAETKTRINIQNVISFESLKSGILNLLNIQDILSGDEIIDFIVPEISRSDIASIVYTSGTTGPPKGVIQTHENHLSNVRQVLDSGLILEGSSIYLFLPLAHSFAKLMSYIAALTPISLCMPEVSDNLSSKLKPLIIFRDMSSLGASIIPIVPRFLEKIKDQLQTESGKKGLKAKLLALTLWSANPKPTGFTQLVKLLCTPVRAKIKKQIFGTKFKYCISGGAKLSPSVHSFFDQLNIMILEGYGLTETVVATNVCTLDKRKVGSVGPVLASDINLRIASDGEIQFKGPNIFSGYLNRPTASKNAFTADGWFVTGDLGRIDENGFLYVEGRKKELIVTSGGKKIAPLAIEEKIMSSVLVSQAALFGDGRKYCITILTLNPVSVKEILNIDLSVVDDPNQNEQIHSIVSSHISSINKELASYETVKKFYIAKEEFSIENGLLTPSMKVKKTEVEKRYLDEINKMY
jgi:long-chain acyl-CoA synthetase